MYRYLKEVRHFWRHSNCPNKFKVQAQDAIIRTTKLIYGLDSAEFNQKDLNKWENFQYEDQGKYCNRISHSLMEATQMEKCMT